MHCRICDEDFEYPGSKKHFEAHKRKFCSEKNIPLHNWFRIPWEDVVRHFNPSKAKSVPIIIPNPQLSLDKFKQKEK